MENVSPTTIRHWKEVPAMPALGFKELALTTFPVSRAIRIFKTSGTTAGKRGAHFFDTLMLYDSSILEPFRRQMLSDGMKLSYFFLMNSPGKAKDSSLSHMMGVVNRSFAGNKGKFYIDGKNERFAALEKNLRASKRPVFLLATAFSLKAFLDHLKKENIRIALPPGSRLMETGGFKGRITAISKNALYKECSARLGIPRRRCFSEYGMTELSSQMYDAGRGFEAPAWFKAQVIDPKTGRQAAKGRSGLIRLVDLANRGSVIAVQTEDIGRIEKGRLRVLARAARSDIRGCSLSYEEFLKNAD